jgi:hypothetical protein
MKYSATAFAIMLIPAAAFAISAQADHSSPDHGAMQHSGAPAPHQGHGETRHALTQAGQATFAAIQEIVAALEADPSTDWSTANVERLRQHLIDMDNAMLRSTVQAVPIRDGTRFIVSGTGESIGSIRRMTAGHASTMDGDGGWTFRASNTEHGAILEVTSPHPDDAAKIRALGFAGILVRGNHHQPHHLAIAAGRPVH